MSLRNTLIVLVAILALAAVYKAFIYKPASASNEVIDSERARVDAPPIQISPTTAPTIEKGFTSYDEVKAYMAKLQNVPIPADYEIPEYIKSGLTRDAVYEIFSTRYPMFYGYGSTQLLDSIIANAQMYDVMLTENKAIRRYYDPNSKY